MREKCPKCGILRFQRYEWCPKCGHHYEPIPLKKKPTSSYQKCMECIHFHYETLEHYKSHPKHQYGWLYLYPNAEERFHSRYKYQGYCDLHDNGKILQRTRPRCKYNFEEKKDDTE